MAEQGDHWKYLKYDIIKNLQAKTHPYRVHTNYIPGMKYIGGI